FSVTVLILGICLFICLLVNQKRAYTIDTSLVFSRVLFLSRPPVGRSTRHLRLRSSTFAASGHGSSDRLGIAVASAASRSSRVRRTQWHSLFQRPRWRTGIPLRTAGWWNRNLSSWPSVRHRPISAYGAEFRS